MLVAETARPARLPLRVRVGRGARLARARRRRGAARPSDASCRRPPRSPRSARSRRSPRAAATCRSFARRLAELRETANPEGIEEAEAAAAALAETFQPEPRLASGDYLDAIGVGVAPARAGARRDRRLSLRRGDAGGARRRRGAQRRGRAELQAAARLTRRHSLPLRMEGGGFGFPFGGDPEDIMRGLREFAEQQAESVQEAQREQFATLTLNTAVELTSAALRRSSRRAASTSRRSRSATRCASSSPRRWRSSAPRARGSCARSPRQRHLQRGSAQGRRGTCSRSARARTSRGRPWPRPVRCATSNSCFSWVRLKSVVPTSSASTASVRTRVECETKRSSQADSAVWKMSNPKRRCQGGAW